MVKYFWGSYIFTILGLIGAFLFAHHSHPGSEFNSLFVVVILALLEISLSFDNAVVNAMKLEKMAKIWRFRFLTWGILIAVFGMRFLFPVLVVAIFAHLDFVTVTQIALIEPDKYSQYLEATHAPIVTFGGLFLMMLFFNYFTNPEKELHWLRTIELPLKNSHKIKGFDILISLISILILQHFIPTNQKVAVLVSGIFGIITFLVIEGISTFLEDKESQTQLQCAQSIGYAGLVSFIYLELIDASFSLDGVLGAFALSNDVVIITIGLAIGAMFVRSLTIMLVEKNTLTAFPYLEHGAHWAIGALSVIMLIETVYNVPELVTGFIGLIFIGLALISSILENRANSQH